MGTLLLAAALWATVLSSLAAGENPRLVDAAKARDRATVEMLLRQRVDVNARQGDGATALHWAVHWDELAMADLLIAAGADVNIANVHGATPLILAVTNGSAPMVQRLLQAGALPNGALPTGETPLMRAARSGNADVVRQLLARGADAEIKESRAGQNALMWAAAEGHSDVVRTLLGAGANVNARSNGGFTALMFAAREGHVSTGQVLLDAGADVGAMGKSSTRRVGTAGSAGADLRTQDGSTALLIASYSVVTFDDGDTDEHWVLQAPSEHEAFALMLLDRGADPNLADENGMTPLHAAARTRRLQLVKALLRRGANPSARIIEGPGMETPGSSLGNIEPRLDDGTPLHVAAMVGDMEIVRALLEGGADPLALAKNNLSVLMVASCYGRIDRTLVSESVALEMTTFLLENFGGDVNAVDPSNGFTIMHGCAFHGYDRVIEYLAAKGAKLDVRDKMGRTPLSIAEGASVKSLVHIKNPRTAALLRKLGARIGLKETNYVGIPPDAPREVYDRVLPQP